MSVSKSIPARPCATCGMLFVPTSSPTQRFCSYACSCSGRTRPLAQRFWEKVDKNGPVPANRPELGPCWVWTGATSYGYGRVFVHKDESGRNVTRPAHTVAYELLVGPIPHGLVPDHLCLNHACVNPSHLEPVTRAENTLRGTGRNMVVHRSLYCGKGHEKTPENVYVSPREKQRCRLCDAMREERRRTTRAAIADRTEEGSDDRGL